MNNTADWNVTSCCHCTLTNGSKEPEGGTAGFCGVGKFLPDNTARQYGVTFLTFAETSNLLHQTGCGVSQHCPVEFFM
jgi:hypothetical protein